MCTAFALALLLVGCSPQPPTVDLLVENVKIYPASGEAAFTGNVAIRDGQFVAVTTSDDMEFTAATTIDGSGKFMTPGLWDAHVHTRSSESGGLDVAVFLRHGVTSIHDLGGYLPRMQQLEQEMAGGTVTGPSIYPAYFMLNGESFADYQHVVTTEAEVRSAIAELAAAGAAQVKVHRALAPDTLPIVVRIAREQGLNVTGHIPFGVHPLDACRIGMRGIEHIGSFAEAIIAATPADQADSSNAIEYLLSDAATPIYACLAEQDVAVTPTLVIYPAIARRRSEGAEMPQEYRDFIESMQRIAFRLHESGVRLLVGTDTSDYSDGILIEPGAAVLDEMQMLEEAGIEPLEVLRMATLSPAHAIGAADTSGSIEPGKDADFLLLSADPGETVRNLRALDQVFKRGVMVYSKPL